MIDEVIAIETTKFGTLIAIKLPNMDISAVRFSPHAPPWSVGRHHQCTKPTTMDPFKRQRTMHHFYQPVPGVPVAPPPATRVVTHPDGGREVEMSVPAVVTFPDGTRVEPVQPVQQPAEEERATKKRQFNKTTAARVGLPKPLHRLLFADAIDAAMAAVGNAAFAYLRAGTPLAAKGQKIRGTIAEEVVKAVLERKGEEIVPAEGSLCVDGAKRGKGMELCDFGCVVEEGAIRCESKNARMVFAPSMQMWKLEFKNVKKDEFDDLYLCFEGLDGIRIYKWKGQNYCKDAEREKTEGGSIVVCASRSQPDIEKAQAQLVEKMAERNEFVAFVPYDDPSFSHFWKMTSVTADVYDDVPLAAFSQKARGDALEGVVRWVVKNVLGHTVSDAPVTDCCDGSKRGKKSTESDVMVDGKLAEGEAGEMVWNKYHKRFHVHFKGVKKDLHEVLYLAWMTPRGVHIFLHDGKAGLSKGGKGEEANGKDINFYAPGGKKGYRVPDAAEKYLLKHMVHGKKLTYLAFLEFRPGDTERVLARAQ